MQIRTARHPHGILLWLATLSLFFTGVRSNAATNQLWEKIVMVGASASSGFTASEPLGGTNTVRLRLSRYVDAAVSAPHEPVLNLAHAMFFLQPESAGKSQMTRALKEQPSLLLGVDFLFWFLYGKGTNDTERLLRFEYGLKLLEPVSCPLVLGDIPDASAAVNKMLSPSQIPTTNAMVAANARLKAWAATRRDVVLVPLSRLIQVAALNQPFTVHRATLPAGRTRVLLQEDNLHPSPPGCAVIALVALDQLQARYAYQEADVRWEPTTLVRAVSETLRAAQNPHPKPVSPEPVAR